MAPRTWFLGAAVLLGGAGLGGALSGPGNDGARAVGIDGAPRELAPVDPPRLVVVVAVDQMRADYLDRFGHLFEGGLARVLREGSLYTDAHQDHAATVTAPGHATIATGVFPARHGIVGNDYFERAEGRSVYSAADSTAPLLGVPGAPGRSPARLRRDGLADWLKAASPDSKVFSVAIKDRSAIMMAGRSPDGAYWYHAPARRFVTSTYYAAEYPEWVEAFGAEALIGSYYGRGWDRLLPPEAYAASREDSFPAEGGGGPFVFPYRFAEVLSDTTPESPDDGWWELFRYTPYGDEVTLLFAEQAVEHEALGSDGTPDFLFVGCSSADYVGHRWGPYSQEVQDYYLRLDRYLGRFFSFLDERVGAGEWALVVTGDHGVAPAPEEAVRRGIDARRILGRDFWLPIRDAYTAAAVEVEIDPVPRPRWAEGVVLLGGDPTPRVRRELRETVARRVATIGFVAEAFSAERVAEADPWGDRPIHFFRRSFDPERTPDVLVHLRPYHVVGTTTGIHGSAHPYDTHVPLVFVGPGVTSGRHADRVRTVDIAPTLAAMLGIRAPEDLDGRVLAEALPR